MSLRLDLTLALLAICLLTAASAAVAGNFAVTAMPGPDPSSWTFELFNNSDPADMLILSGLDLFWEDGVEIPAFTITSTPAGWVVNDQYNWPAWDAVGNEPESGSSLPGFDVTTSIMPTKFTVWYYQLTDFLFEDGDVTTVPEPASMAAVLSGLAGLCAVVRRRRP